MRVCEHVFSGLTRPCSGPVGGTEGGEDGSESHRLAVLRLIPNSGKEYL